MSLWWLLFHQECQTLSLIPSSWTSLGSSVLPATSETCLIQPLLAQGPAVTDVVLLCMVGSTGHFGYLVLFLGWRSSPRGSSPSDACQRCLASMGLHEQMALYSTLGHQGGHLPVG